MMNLLKEINAIDTTGLISKQIMMVRLMRLKVKCLVLMDQLLLLLLLLLRARHLTLSDSERKNFINSGYNKFTNDILDAEIKEIVG